MILQYLYSHIFSNCADDTLRDDGHHVQAAPDNTESFIKAFSCLNEASTGYCSPQQEQSSELVTNEFDAENNINISAPFKKCCKLPAIQQLGSSGDLAEKAVVISDQANKREMVIIRQINVLKVELVDQEAMKLVVIFIPTRVAVLSLTTHIQSQKAKEMLEEEFSRCQQPIKDEIERRSSDL